MNREYLEDYFQKEKEEQERYLKRLQEGKYSFEKDKFPPDHRFINIQKPVATIHSLPGYSLWPQVPFSGSSIFRLHPWSSSYFEDSLFRISDIPKIIDFVKDTGRLQVVLAGPLSQFVGLDFLDPFLQELVPPMSGMTPLSFFWDKKEIERAKVAFYTLARVKYFDFMEQEFREFGKHIIHDALNQFSQIYATLKLGRYMIVEEIENATIDDPPKALALLHVCANFIVDPFLDTRSDIHNYPLETARKAELLPLIYQPREVRFPFEIGKFLLGKLTYAPQGLRACYDIIDHYDAYDLQKVQESLNEAIVREKPDVLNKNVKAFSEILDNVWNDPTIPRKTKELKIGMPLLIAALGNIAAGPIGATGGFLAGLGFEVLTKIIDVEAEGLSEKIAKLRSKSYQVNIYDFKKKYKSRIRTD